MSLGKMAWRNLWRNRRRSLVTMAAMTLALLVTTLYTGLIGGYFEDMERNVLDRELGDLQIVAPGYRDDPSIYTRIADPGALLARLDRAGYAASARLFAGALAAAGDSSAGVSLRGVDVAREARVSVIGRHVATGAWLDPARPGEVVIGRRLARTLDVRPGAEILLLAQAADGSMANRLYTVRGVLKGIGEGTDRTAVFMTEPALRELMVLPTGAHEVVVRRPAGVALDAAAAAVTRLAPGLEVETWRQLAPTLASMLDSTRGAMYVIVVIVYIAIGIVILNAMLMAVFERIRELGVLKALGMGPFAVLRLVLLETAVMTGLALCAGLALSLPGLWYLARVGLDLSRLGGFSMLGVAWDPVWRAAVTPATFTSPVVTLVVVVAVATVYPALKAARLRPLEAMRHQ